MLFMNDHIKVGVISEYLANSYLMKLYYTSNQRHLTNLTATIPAPNNLQLQIDPAIQDEVLIPTGQLVQQINITPEAKVFQLPAVTLSYQIE